MQSSIDEDATTPYISRKQSAKLTKMIRQQRENVEILREVAGELLVSLKPQEIIQEICLKITSYLNCHIFLNYIIDEAVPRLHLNASTGIPADSREDLEWIGFGAQICGIVAKDGRKMIVENLQESNDNKTNFLKSIGIRAYACFPLLEQNTGIGTLSFGTKLKDSFDEDDLALMYAFADLVAVAMSRQRAVQILEKQQLLMIKAEMEKNEALKKAMEMKDEFLSFISHEFKTPLTVIYSAVQAMQTICRSELSPKAKGYLNKILQNANRQLKLVNNLLDITRVNSGHLKVNRANIDIVYLAQSITESIRVFAEQKGILLSFSSTLQKKVIATDEEKVERILLNLLSNAVKNTPEGKSIKVRVFQKVMDRKCKVCVQVRDRGFGIPNDMLEMVFKRFGQVDRSLSMQAEGTGIGLYLVKMLVDLLEGDITLESKVEQGSTFTILLPVGKIKNNSNEQMIREMSDNRLIRASAIEFSDIYLPCSTNEHPLPAMKE